MKFISHNIVLFAFVWVMLFESDIEGRSHHDYNLLSDKAKRQYCREMEKSYSLKLIGTGGGEIDGIKVMGLDFTADHPMNVADARRLYVNCVEHLLKRIHNEQALKGEIPATTNSLEFSIDFHNLASREPYRLCNSNLVTYMKVYKGIIYYLADGPGSKSSFIHEESYDDALKIVKNET